MNKDQESAVDMIKEREEVAYKKIEAPFAKVIVRAIKEKPYYEILYFDLSDESFHIGFGSYCLENVFKWLNEEFEYVKGAGTLVRVPCKVGTECYYANPALHEVCPSEIIKFEINKYTNPSLWIEFEYISRWVGGHVRKIREDSAFGKLLFFTKEEAEQALKGGAQ